MDEEGDGGRRLGNSLGAFRNGLITGQQQQLEVQSFA